MCNMDVTGMSLMIDNLSTAVKRQELKLHAQQSIINPHTGIHKIRVMDYLPKSDLKVDAEIPVLYITFVYYSVLVLDAVM